MKKLILLLTACVLSMAASAQQYRVLQSDMSQVRIQYTSGVPQVEDVTLMGQTFSLVTLKGYDHQNHVGNPALPSLTKLIEMPLGQGLEYTIEARVVDTVDAALMGVNHPIVPAQPSRSKSDTSAHKLAMNAAAYSSYDAQLGDDYFIKIEGVGVARSRNLARVTFNPIRWNPVTGQLIIVKEMTVSFRQRQADIAATRSMMRRYDSPAYQTGNTVINSIAAKDGHTNAPLRYTIIAHSSFRGALDTFALWKTRKGFLVDLVYTDDPNVGATTTTIKNYLKGLYDNASAESPAPTYVLLVGDIAQVPAFQVTSGGESQHSDLPYCCWTSGDYIPDCYYGRFSAQNLSQLTPQIEKTLMYEQYTFADPSYLSHAVLISGVDGGYSSDNAYKYCDPTMDFAAKTYVNSSNGFTTVTYYKNNTSFAPTGVTVTGSSQDNATAATLRNLYNQGVGFVNYSAHGDVDSWYRPSLTVTHVSQMTNNGKPMVMIGNCCLTNSMQIDACLGEALLRKDNNAGAVAYIGASNVTYWSEDFYWSVGYRTNINNTCNPSYDANNMGMYDKLFHTHNEPYSQWYTTTSAMIFAGNMAVEGTTSSLREYYWQVYHVMGDPSLMPYFGEAGTLTAQHNSSLAISSTSLTVNTVPYAYVGFTSPNHTLVAAAFADAQGVATLSFDPLTTIGVYELVVTAQDYRPYIAAINVFSNGPYVTTNAVTPENTLDAGNDVSFRVVLKNHGNADANFLTVEFQTISSHLLLSQSGQDTITLATPLAPNNTLTLTGKGLAHIADNVEDGTVSQMKIIVRWGGQTDQRSENIVNLTLNAPNLRVSGHSLTDDFDNTGAGTLQVTVANRGQLASSAATANLVCLEPTMMCTNATQQLAPMAPNATSALTYHITVNGELPENTKIPILHVINDGQRTHSDTIYFIHGQDTRVLTFEDDTWSSLSWQNNSYPWSRVNSDAHSGTYCLRSYNYGNSYSGNNKTSELKIEWTSTIDDSITFYHNVSSESGYDFFRFFIDNQEKESSSGPNNSWARSAYPVSAGTHTFTFRYVKDQSVNDGSDCAWIDDLHLPTNGPVVVYTLDSICYGSDYTFMDTTYSTSSFEGGLYHWVDTINNVIYKISLVIDEPIALTLESSHDTIRAGESVRLTVSGADRYEWSNGESAATIDVYPTETTTYVVTGYRGGCQATDSITVYVDGTIGIANVETASLNLYPNPAHNRLTVAGDGIRQLTVTNMVGQQMAEQEVSGSETLLDVSNWSTGVYIVVATTDNGEKIIRKFIKQ